MPLIKIECNGDLTEEKKEKISLKASKICAETMGKPESYVMSIIRDKFFTAIGGRITPCAFVEVKGIGGFSPEINKKLSQKICSLLREELNISPSAVYINFTNISPSDWGWNCSTF
ncbi:MAG TPA: phenylpyruvate tautomerase MIF-related protein [Victivallales bacterium]|nr:phenylpyruvate tautomerase MIF-related protein [Victivallales bacterium]